MFEFVAILFSPPAIRWLQAEQVYIATIKWCSPPAAAPFTVPFSAFYARASSSMWVKARKYSVASANVCAAKWVQLVPHVSHRFSHIINSIKYLFSGWSKRACTLLVQLLPLRTTMRINSGIIVKIKIILSCIINSVPTPTEECWESHFFQRVTEGRIGSPIFVEIGSIVANFSQSILFPIDKALSERYNQKRNGEILIYLMSFGICCDCVEILLRAWGGIRGDGRATTWILFRRRCCCRLFGYRFVISFGGKHHTFPF